MADGLLSGAPKPMGGLLGFLGDPDRRARLAMALEGMTLNPNQAFIQSLGEGIKARADKAEAEKTRNATAQWLRSQGREDLASAVESGAVDGSAAATAAMQRPDPVRGVEVGNRLVNPVTGEVIYTAPEGAGGMNSARVQELQWRAREAGLQPGTPEYQQFILSGGGGIGDAQPAAFVALDLQAKAAGFQPGTPEYRDFMATRGAGLSAEASAMGKARGEAVVAAPQDVAFADQTLAYIDEVRKHPGLDLGTGATAMANVIPGTSGYDFQNRVNQLKSGAFMTAIDDLRGMGALSNAEGQTATAAVTRMDTATSKGEFLSALDDYERVVKRGRDRAAGRINKPEVQQPAETAGQPSDEDLLRMYGGE